MLTALTAGLAAGGVHALSGPDHLAAITPLTADAPRGAWRVGFRWGLGHATGVALVGGVAILLRGFINLEALTVWGERLVAVMLIGVGLWGLRRALSKWVHSHTHQHDDHVHLHIHLHRPGVAHESPTTHRHTHAAFAVGTLHGAAGTSHLFGILPALALPTKLGAITYLAGYGAGNIIAMAIFSWLIGTATLRVGALGLRPYRAVLGSASAAAIVVGIVWLAMA